MALAPDGRVALFFTASNGMNGAPCRCTTGSTLPKAQTCGSTVVALAYASNCSGRAFPTVLSWAYPRRDRRPWAWSTPITLFNGSAGQPRPIGTYCDTNLAPLILANGSLVGIWRECTPPRPCCDEGFYPTVHPVTALNWLDPATYDWHEHVHLFRSLGDSGPPPEDFYLWRCRRGLFHVLFQVSQPQRRHQCPGGEEWRGA